MVGFGSDWTGPALWTLRSLDIPESALNRPVFQWTPGTSVEIPALWQVPQAVEKWWEPANLTRVTWVVRVSEPVR